MVNCVCFSPCGKYLATGSADKTANIFSVESGAEVKTLSGHTSAVTSVRFSPCGKHLATGSADKTANIFNVESGGEVMTLTGHINSVNSVCFSPCGKYLATGSEDNTAKIFSVDTRAEVKTLSGHTWSVTAVSFSPCGKFLATGSGDTTAKLFSVETSAELKLVGLAGAVSLTSWSVDGRFLAVQSPSGRRVFCVATGAPAGSGADGAAFSAPAEVPNMAGSATVPRFDACADPAFTAMGCVGAAFVLGNPNLRAVLLSV